MSFLLRVRKYFSFLAWTVWEWERFKWPTVYGSVQCPVVCYGRLMSQCQHMEWPAISTDGHGKNSLYTLTVNRTGHNTVWERSSCIFIWQWMNLAFDHFRPARSFKISPSRVFIEQISPKKCTNQNHNKWHGT